MDVGAHPAGKGISQEEGDKSTFTVIAEPRIPLREKQNLRTFALSEEGLYVWIGKEPEYNLNLINLKDLSDWKKIEDYE